MEKYMGNKSKMVSFIFDVVEKESLENERVIFDAFTGTTNVGKYFKSKGYQVIVNDINDFSNIFGKSYICNNYLPSFSKLLSSNFYSKKNYEKIIKTVSFIENKERLINENKNLLNDKYISLIKDTEYLNILVYLTYYSTAADYDNSYDNGIKKKELYEFIQRNYTEIGSNAAYINLVDKKTLDNIQSIFYSDKRIKEANYICEFYDNKEIKYLISLLSILNKNDNEISSKINKIICKKNVVGRRKFFSIEHAKKIDIILNTIWYWKNNGLLQEYEYDILLTSVIESIAIFSNTSATYQAFYKDYKANTMQSFRLIIPKLLFSDNEHVSLQGDIFDNINKQDYDILYLDPPYNWRQYDSNYHLLNTVAKLNDLDDISSFEKGIIGASGENREKKLKYTSFNQKSTFQKRLFSLIEEAKSSLVVLSYSDSDSNHNVNNVGVTITELEKFFQDDRIFVKDSFKKYNFERQNFESRRSNKKQKINELIFVARKK